eukprot:13461498-Alexandrium_andersonii.AAC.1
MADCRQATRQPLRQPQWRSRATPRAFDGPAQGCRVRWPAAAESGGPGRPTTRTLQAGRGRPEGRRP